MTYSTRLVAYAPNGPRLGLLPFPLSYDVAMPLGDVPSLRLGYSTHAPGSSLLADPCEIALEYSVDDAPWVEPPDARFLRLRRSGDVNDVTGARSYTCPGYAWQTRKLVLYPNDALVDGKRPFLAVSPGAILMTFINEGQARDTLTELGTDFDTETDSAGQPWAETLTLYYEPGTDLQTALINLHEQGVLDWRMNGRTLQAYNADAELGRDLAAGNAPVDLRLGRDVTDAPDDGTYEDAASAVLVAGDAGLSVEVDNPTADAPWGRWEQFQGQGGVTDSGTAQILAQAALERAGRERVQITRGITLDVARWLPLADYRPGDHLLAPGDGGAMESLRIRQITLSRRNDGEISGNLVLNDRFLEREIKLARKTSGILGGSTATGGTGVDPAPEQDDRVPAAPTGLIVDPVAYIDSSGFPQGAATATWGHVTADVDGVALDVDGYELYMRINESGALWFLVGTTAPGDNSTTTSPLNVDWEYAFKVRATSNGVKGEFSEQVAVLIPNDATPPPIPSAPALTTRLGVIHVAWDGLDEDGFGMPADFDRLRVWMQDPLAPGYVEVDYLTAAGTVVIPGQPYNTDRQIRFTAIDYSGNESAPSAAPVIATQPLVDTDVIGEVISGANIVDGSITASEKVVAESITGGLIAALAIEAGNIAANAIQADKIAAGAVEAGHIAANAITADKIAAGAVDADALTADAITGKTITGSLIRTAATGQRIVIDPSTLDIRFYPDGNSNYSRLWTSDTDFPGEATFRINSGTNDINSANSVMLVAAGYTLMAVEDPDTGLGNGGFLESAESYARIGYDNASSDNQYMWFDGSGMTTHYGKWWDSVFAANTWGIHSGSLISPAGQIGERIFYGPTMQGNMGPVCTVRDGAGQENFTWCLTASNQSFFDVGWSKSGTSDIYTGKATYWWSFRHNGAA